MDRSKYPAFSEEWRPFPGWEADYRISNRGEVRRVTPGHGTRPGRVLQHHLNSMGYPRVHLPMPNHKAAKVLVHRAVASAFLGPCPAGLEINHKDFNPRNPSADNLEYVTRSANLTHAFAHGRAITRGTARANAVLTEEAVRGIRSSTDSLKTLARRFGVSTVTILKVRRREKWSHVSDL